MKKQTRTKNISVYLILIALLVLVAGCTTERKPTIDANNGIIINEFSAEPNPAKTGELVMFFADIENVGGTTARNVEVILFGVENSWRTKAVNTPAVTKNDAVKAMGTVSPPSLTTNRAGDFKIAQWQFLPPSNLPDGVTTNFPITARVIFDYKSTSTVTIPAFSDSLFTIKRNKGEAIDTQPRIDNSHSPVQIRLTKATTPLVVDEKKGGVETATFIMEFVNVGSGFPVTDGTAGRMKGVLRLLGPGVQFSDCLGATSGTEINNINVDLIKLRSDGRVPFGCSIKIDRSKWTPTMSGSITFAFEIDFKYFVEKSITLPVRADCQFCVYTQTEDRTNMEAWCGPNFCPEGRHFRMTCFAGGQEPSCVWGESQGGCASKCGNCECSSQPFPQPPGTTPSPSPTPTPTPTPTGRVPCIYDDNGKACAGTNPHCSDASHCDLSGCGYNPNVFNYDSNVENYACTKGGTVVCEYSEPTQGICLGTNPRCDNDECSQRSAGCGYNPKKFDYAILKRDGNRNPNYACRSASTSTPGPSSGSCEANCVKNGKCDSTCTGTATYRLEGGETASCSEITQTGTCNGKAPAFKWCYDSGNNRIGECATNCHLYDCSGCGGHHKIKECPGSCSDDGNGNANC